MNINKLRRQLDYNLAWDRQLNYMVVLNMLLKCFRNGNEVNITGSICFGNGNEVNVTGSIEVLINDAATTQPTKCM